MNSGLKFSIITVCKDPGIKLSDTIESLRSQSYRNFELIVIDGNSKDGTPELLNKCFDLDLKIISEKDDGIYDAMNKGLRCATADYVFFLNAGDTFFEPSTLRSVADAAAKHRPDLVYGDAFVFTPGEENGQYLRRHDCVDIIYLVTNTITHQAIFAKREVFRDVGEFDLRFKRKADHDWIIRCWRRGMSFFYLPKTIVNYPNDGFSKEFRGKYFRTERTLLYKKNFSTFGIFLFRISSRLGLLKYNSSRLRKLLSRIL